MTESPAPPQWRGQVARVLGSGLVHTLYAARAYGREHIPDQGPVIIAANHTGLLDGPVVLSLCPRPSHFLVLKQSFDDRLFGPILTFSGQIPIDQQQGDRAALSAALEVLRRGDVLGIFPEGGRGRGDLAEAGKGVAWLALQSGARVIPTACLGTRKTGELASSWPPLRSRLVVDFGAPVDVRIPQGVPGRVRLQQVTDQLRSALATHVSQASERHGIALPTDVPPDLIQT